MPASLARLLRPHQQTAVLFYPLTVLISFLYAALGLASESYFSNKRNVLNVYFVKIGWFWVTVVYLGYLLLNHRDDRRRIQGIVRYAFVTLYWYAMTQWLLGPSFIDRVFVATGGQCQAEELIVNGVFAQQACRKAGGRWAGGHDVSGHCVLLIHASLFLWEEISWMYYSIPALQRRKQENGWAWRSMVAVFTLLILSWWMLVMTSVYFHGHYELVSGCFFGLVGWAVLYLGVFPRLPLAGLPPVSI
ncbi:hypothetical protein DFQ28_006804 [Apophysomyces sp. BC1034]|nr:hypothetical protein DFQ30_006603 [Apophysomyces sp. BC1015]KAG0176887.1 hypothetical protein DFQ29_005496 [Apophysomyces sp. BC1021]KAG0187156.1 hypothetical protein DFQ28_006804 [Apophysomyces sp. BC1034]